MLFLQPCGVDGALLLSKKKAMWNDDEKGQRRPDIFEIATAYENGNGGIIRPRTNVWNSKKKTKELFDFF